MTFLGWLLTRLLLALAFVACAGSCWLAWERSDRRQARELRRRLSRPHLLVAGGCAEGAMRRGTRWAVATCAAAFATPLVLDRAPLLAGLCVAVLVVSFFCWVAEDKHG